MRRRSPGPACQRGKAGRGAREPGAQVGFGARRGEAAPPGLPAAKWSGVDFLPAVSRLFTFSGVTSLLTRSTSPLRQASNSSRAAGSMASAAAPAQAAPPPAQRRPDMILAAAAASSSASNGSRSPGPASRRARPPGGDALRAWAAQLPPVTGVGAVPWPRRRTPLAGPREPPTAPRRRRQLEPDVRDPRRRGGGSWESPALPPAPRRPGSASDDVLRVRSGRSPAGPVSASEGARRGLWEMRPREEKGIRPTAIFAVGFTEVERLCYCPFLKREFPCFVTPRRAFESVIPTPPPRSCILYWNSHCGSFPPPFLFQLPQSLSPGGFIFCFPFLFLPCSPPDGKFGCAASRSFK